MNNLKGSVSTDHICIIYPSWANFWYKWRDLPSLFLNPDKWGRNFDIPKLKQLGYTVSEDDHALFDGPSGGGIIEQLGSGQRWFPRALFTSEASLTTPKGFIRSGACGIFVLVPILLAKHRIGGEPVPMAPSPHFSVEQIPSDASECSVALGVAKPDAFDDSEFISGFPSLHLGLKRLEKKPPGATEVFSKIDDPRLTWFWYSIQHSGLTPSAWIAAIVYLGLRLADLSKNNLRDLHIFTQELGPGVAFPSAELWTSRKTKGIIRTANDW